MKGHGEKRSRKADTFITALIGHPTIEAAAQSAGISNATAWRWMQDPEFARAYKNARREVMRHAMARIQEAAREAVECLRSLIREGQSEAARVAASRTILEQATKALDLEDIQERLTALERECGTLRGGLR